MSQQGVLICKRCWNIKQAENVVPHLIKKPDVCVDAYLK